MFTAKGCRRVGQLHIQIVAIALGIDLFGLIVIQREPRSQFTVAVSDRFAFVYLPFAVFGLGVTQILVDAEVDGATEKFFVCPLRGSRLNQPLRRRRVVHLSKPTRLF